MQAFSRFDSKGVYTGDMSQGRPSTRERSAFGQRLFDLREAAGLTQAEVAEQLDIGQRSYSAWERDTIAIQPERLKRLAEILGTTVGELVGEAPPKRAAAPRGKLNQVFDAASKLPRRQQKKILDVVEPFIREHAAEVSSS
jgi:transcriptional regulator with XRE-family HTH domain